MKYINNVDKIFNDIKSKGFKYIEELIESKQEENLFLDFKEKRSPNQPYTDRDDRKNYAKALSGFSNASGGIIIWGIEARRKDKFSPDVAVGIKPIKHLRKFITDLNSLTHSSLIPVNNQVQNIPIFLKGERDTGLAITYVPESDLYPHRALLGVHQYYTRAGDSFVVMEHHLLEDSFGKKNRPRLNVKYSTSLGHKNEILHNLKNDDIHLHINFALQNVGKYLSKYPALKIRNKNYRKLKVKFKQHQHKLSDNNLSEVKLSNNEYYYISNHNLIIHPSMTLPIVTVTIKMKKSEFYALVDTHYVFSFEYEVYSQNFQPISGTINIKASSIQNKYKNYLK